MSNSVDIRPLSLVDIVKVLYFRRYIFVAIFGLIVMLGTWFVISKDRTYQYSSYYSLGTLVDGEYLESPPTMELRVREIGYPAALEQRMPSGEGEAQVDMAIDTLPDSGMIRLVTFAPKKRAEEVVELHKALLAFIDARQVTRYKRQKEEYQIELKAVVNALDSLPSDSSGSASLPVLLQKKAELEKSLNSMVPGEVIVTARVNDRPAGFSNIVLMLGVLIFSSVISLIFTYLTEFCAVVRNSLEKDSRYGG